MKTVKLSKLRCIVWIYIWNTQSDVRKPERKIVQNIQDEAKIRTYSRFLDLLKLNLFPVSVHFSKRLKRHDKFWKYSKSALSGPMNLDNPYLNGTYFDRKVARVGISQWPSCSSSMEFWRVENLNQGHERSFLDHLSLNIYNENHTFCPSIYSALEFSKIEPSIHQSRVISKKLF